MPQKQLEPRMSRRRDRERRRVMLYDKLSIAAVVLSVVFGSWVAFQP
jgi:hypothetical protein